MAKSSQNTEKIVPQTQIIHFVGGTKRTVRGIIRIWENEWTHLLDINGTEWIINKNNVLCVERVGKFATS